MAGDGADALSGAGPRPTRANHYSSCRGFRGHGVRCRNPAPGRRAAVLAVYSSDRRGSPEDSSGAAASGGMPVISGRKRRVGDRV